MFINKFSLMVRQARRGEARAVMEHQFRQSMTAPEWEMEDYDWRVSCTFAPAHACKMLTCKDRQQMLRSMILCIDLALSAHHAMQLTAAGARVEGACEKMHLNFCQAAHVPAQQQNTSPGCG